jgi:hypothetical protein
MEERCVILYASEYAVTDERTGRTNSGVSISYIMSDSLDPVADGRTKGYRIMKGSLPDSAAIDVESVPGVYNVQFSIKPDSSGKPTLKPAAIQFVSAI